MADEAIPLPAEAVALAVRPDRPELLVWTADGGFSFFDLSSRKRIGEPVPLGNPEPDPRTRPARRIEFSPDGRQWLAFGDRWVWVWGVGTRERVAAIQGGPSVDAAAFSPDGRWVAYAGMDGRVCFWDRRAGAPDPLRLELGRPVVRLRFSPDGARVVCLVMDGTVETWDQAGRRRVGDVPAVGRRPGIGALVGDPAGRLVCAGREAIALIDSATGKQVGPPLGIGERVEGMAVDMAGHTLAVCTATATQLIDLPADAGADPARPSIEALTGLSIDPRGTLVPLTAEAWHAHRRPPAGEHPD
jgi:WD40 repeat protein